MLVALVSVLAVACQASSAPVPTATPTRAPTPLPILAPAPARASPSAASSPSPLARSPSPSAATLVASPSAVAARPLVYTAIGASDTVGVGAADPAHDGWVPQLAQLLGRDVRVHNLGVSGTLLHTAVQDQLPVAIHDQPDLVTVWLAVNDLDARVPLDQYSADLNELLGSLASQTHAVVLVANVPDLTLVPAYRSQDPSALHAVVARWNQAIAQAAAQHGAHVVDLFAAYAELAAHPEDLSADGFHPSSAGYKRVAELFYATARPLLGR